MNTLVDLGEALGSESTEMIPRTLLFRNRLNFRSAFIAPSFPNQHLSAELADTIYFSAPPIENGKSYEPVTRGRGLVSVVKIFAA